MRPLALTVARNRLLVLSAVMTLLAPVTAQALNAPGLPRAPGRDGAVARIAEVDAAVRRGGVAGLVDAAVLLAGHANGRQTPGALSAPASLPSALSPAVAGLLAGIAQAQEASRALVGDPSAVEEVYARLRASADDLAADDVRGWQRLQAAAADATASIDLRRVAAAAAVLAAAVDAALPALEGYAQTIAPGPRGAACDIVDLPVLCIAGTGANTHERDVALLIDLGGNDRHAHGAGAADALLGLPVAVTIDVGGNDTYATALPTAAGFTAVHGAARLGIGLLVDAAGDDTYAADGQALNAIAYGQGVGLLGVGVLADLGGNDRYHLQRSRAAGSQQGANGQAYGAVGIGVLGDAGGDDAYLVESHSPPVPDDEGKLLAGSPYAQGLAFNALGGAALFVDGGGRDEATLRAATAPIAPDQFDTLAQGPSGGAEGIGYADFGGNALVLAGSGDSRWTIEAAAHAPVTRGVDVDGFGVAKIGFAAMQDAGGNDTYTISADSVAAARQVLDGPCAAPCRQETFDVEGGQAHAIAGGYGGLGAGVLRDLGGNDTYRAVAHASASAAVENLRADGAGLRAVAAATSGKTTVGAWGVGVLAGVGVFEDLAGDDRYDVAGTSTATADARAAAGDDQEQAGAWSGAVLTGGLALGSTEAHAQFLDLGGTDRYGAAAASTATATPGQGQPDAARTSVVGSVEVEPVNGLNTAGGTAVFVDADGGRVDTFAISPADEACTGTRGTGVWRDCGPGAGVGANS